MSGGILKPYCQRETKKRSDRRPSLAMRLSVKPFMHGIIVSKRFLTALRQSPLGVGSYDRSFSCRPVMVNRVYHEPIERLSYSYVNNTYVSR